MRTYEAPRMPQNWSGEAKSFYLGLIDVLDSLHLPIQEAWLSNNLKAKISSGSSADDTGWQNLTLTGCTAWDEDLTPKVRRIGSLVCVTGAIKTTAAIASNTYATVATLPDGFVNKNRMQLFAPVITDSGNAKNVFIIFPEPTSSEYGKIRIRNRSGASMASGAYITLDCQYMI